MILPLDEAGLDAWLSDPVVRRLAEDVVLQDGDSATALAFRFPDGLYWLTPDGRVDEQAVLLFSEDDKANRALNKLPAALYVGVVEGRPDTRACRVGRP